MTLRIRGSSLLQPVGVTRYDASISEQRQADRGVLRPHASAVAARPLRHYRRVQAARLQDDGGPDQRAGGADPGIRRASPGRHPAAPGTERRPAQPRRYSECPGPGLGRVYPEPDSAQEMDRNNISVTADEVVEAIRSNPPQPILADSSFQTDGKFDPTKYELWLSSTSGRPRFPILKPATGTRSSRPSCGAS